MLVYVQGIERELLPFTSLMISVSMNLKDPYAPAMLGLYTLLVLDTKSWTQRGDFDFAIKGPRLRNSLPMDLRHTPSFMASKKKLKTDLLKRHYYSRD